MLRRQLFFFILVAVPPVVFALRGPEALAALPIAGVTAWWAASPVTYPAWVLRGLARALPVTALLSLALWSWLR